MTTSHPSEKSIFFDALDIPSQQQRTEFVREACAGRPELLESVMDLLKQHESSSPIDQPIVQPMDLKSLPWLSESLDNTELDSVDRWEGVVVGNYRLMELIGEGGFGLVFVAEQTEPIQRKVALKIVKPGMESKEVLARFQAERQAIALMDHPNIAKVFDAGVTPQGQPYFVMELVRGIPITDFCDRHQLKVSDRIQLMISVCQAVQHAHQKGIIHRDLKPTNILVTLQDGKPLAKVIDFGIAKAIGRNLTTQTIYTRFTSMVGTPMYMSPEQAEMSQTDVDTRSDIYSLGVIIYELLTGRPPFESQRLSEVSFDEMRRIIREEAPPRPSFRLSTFEDKLTSQVAQNRQLDVSQLTVAIKRDLDWIVMRSLDKDRNLRYPTAAGLAEDLSRFLQDQPVQARPPSLGYRLSKFSKRNKRALLAGALVGVAWIVGTIAILWQVQVTRFERDEKQRALLDAEQSEAAANEARREVESFNQRLNSASVLLSSGRAYWDSERWMEAATAYSDATRALPQYFLVWLERGRYFASIGLWKEAASDFAQAIQLGIPARQADIAGVPQLLYFAGQHEAYDALNKELESVPDDPFLVAVRGKLVSDLSKEEAGSMVLRAAAVIEQTQQSDDAQESPVPRRFRRMLYGVDLYVLGWAHLRANQPEDAVGFLQQSSEHPWLGKGIELPLLAIAHHRLGEAEEANRYFEESESMFQRLVTESSKQPTGAPLIPWVDWIEFLLHYREACLLIKGYTPAIESRLEALEDMARQAVVE